MLNVRELRGAGGSPRDAPCDLMLQPWAPKTNCLVLLKPVLHQEGTSQSNTISTGPKHQRVHEEKGV